METKILRIEKADKELIKYLCEKTDMRLEKLNEKFFLDDKNVLLVSFEDATPSGFLWGYQLDHFHSEKPYMFLYSIDVFDEYKRKGIGKKLIEQLKVIAIENKCSEIFVFTNDGNDPAKALYESIGAIRENMDDVMYVHNLESK